MFENMQSLPQTVSSGEGRAKAILSKRLCGALALSPNDGWKNRHKLSLPQKWPSPVPEPSQFLLSL